MHDLEPTELHVLHRLGSADKPTLLLLHGLGGTGAVWDRLLDELEWAGDVVVPDLRGHGASPWTHHYSFGSMAGDVAGLLPERRPVVAVGHSMGAIVALGLASGWFGVGVSHVLTVGIKVHWSDDDIASIDKVAAKPPRVFDDERAAREWGAKLAGLFGVVEVDDPILDRATVETAEGWRATLDPRAGLVGPPPLAALHSTLGATRVLHTLGENDPMVTPEHAAEAGRPIEVFDRAGHNAMVEQPAAVLDALTRLVAT